MPLILVNLDTSPIKFCVIEGVYGMFHIFDSCEVDDTHIAFALIRVGKCHFPGLAHKIFEILPTYTTTQIFDNDPVLRVPGWAILFCE